MTPNAILAYGVWVDARFNFKNTPPWVAGNEDYREAAKTTILACQGFHELWVPGDSGYHIRKSTAWKQAGVEILSLGEDAGYLIYAASYHTDWDDVLEVGGSVADAEFAMDARIRHALEVLGIPNTRRPAWLLAAYGN